MADIVCPIWRTPADLLKEVGDNTLYDSPRAGGRYAMSGTAEAMIDRWSDEAKARLTTWLCNQRRLSVVTPEIHSYLLKEIQSERPLTTSERIERAILFFGSYRLGQSFTTPRSTQFDSNDQVAMRLAAETECLTKREMLSLCSLLCQMNLLANLDTRQGTAMATYQPTAEGWLKIEELTRKLPSTTQAFVAMWFNDATRAAFADGIEPAIKDAGYRAVRIDKKEHSNKIDDEIIAEIRRSKFIVADFTCEKEKVRGGVYFEAGFAMGLGIPVIWTVAQQSIGDLHFDTRQYNHIAWDTPANLRAALKARIGAVVGDGPLTVD
ncbi:hypothetical protein EAS56_17720 [Bradyrhizobium guangzhouense]|uniref:CD-NTase-associated protein 12/Pycsar effector protein TIR domain-containing protein n=1 Tax=Bradyrhizobium guangzhouense TaxID=1325095 RepID=A0ABY0E4X2_9BRAD|nr:hypothetical protein [Bradyrhizobium guangzhouense]RXH12347.1 hypothetical protein EAS56_17720 [Bradyrhizobium guangzhouense]